MSRLTTPLCAATAAVLVCAIVLVHTFALEPFGDDKSGVDVIINEIDSDTPGTDVAEFIELYDGGVGNTALDGYVVVFFNGGAVNDASYAAFDLDGFTTNKDGYFTLGNAAVTGVDLTFPNGLIQNGPDAIALFAANSTDFPNGTPITSANIRDALVYGNSSTTDPGLLVLLNPSQFQINENGAGTGTTVSMQRVPNGSGGARNTGTYQVHPPTPDGPFLTPTVATLSLSGRVIDSRGGGIRGARLTIEGGGLGSPREVVSSSFGYYNFQRLPMGTYLVTVSARRYNFVQPSRTVNISDNVRGFDFVEKP